MLEGKTILAVVPARCGSKGIPGKNMKRLHGRSLIGWAGETLAAVPFLDARIISTDSREYADEAVSHGLEAPFLRPAGLSGDTASVVEAMKHALIQGEAHYGLEFDIVLIVEPTSPLRRPDDIKRVVEKLISSQADSVITVSKLDKKFHPKKVLTLEQGRLGFFHTGGAAIVGRQSLDDLYWRNGVCYALTRRCLMENGAIFTGNTLAVVIERPVANIDRPQDLAHASELLGEEGSHRLQAKRSRL